MTRGVNEAGNRIHGTTREAPLNRFAEVDGAHQSVYRQIVDLTSMKKLIPHIMKPAMPVTLSSIVKQRPIVSTPVCNHPAFWPGVSGVFYMDMIYEIRRRHLVQKQTLSAIAHDMGLSRPTVCKHLNTIDEPKYQRDQPLSPKLGKFEEQLVAWLSDEAKLPRPRRRTAHRLFEGLQEIGYPGAYDSVQRFVKRWKSGNTGQKLSEAFVPMAFAPGDACPFDWSQEQVELGGVQDRGVRSEGQVENQVGNVREWLFTPLAHFASFADLNDWLATRCHELAQRNHRRARQAVWS